MRKSEKSVLIISNMYPSKKFPHYGVFVENIEEILKQANFKIRVIGLKKHNKLINKTLSYAIFYIKIFLLYCLSSYDSIYVHYASHCALPILLADKIKKQKIIVNVHGNDLIPETEKDKKFEKIVRKILKRADRIICPSQYFKNYLERIYQIDDAIIYPSGGVDTTKFCNIGKKQARKMLHLSDSNKYVGYVSRIEKNKGWDIFLQAAALLVKKNKGIYFIVVGAGNEYNKYINLKNELNLENWIIEYPLVEQEELVKIYNAIDVFVFPTRRKSESLGLVGLEAMACETITVLPDKYGPTSYGRDGYNSFTFKSDSYKDLYAVINKAIENATQDIKTKARETALQYDRKATSEILINVFKTI